MEMEDIISKYINCSKSNLNIVIDVLEDNIEFLDNKLWSSKQEFKDIIEKIIDIYYNKYYLYTENNFDKIGEYISFNKKINRKLKTLLLSIIDYYESIDSVNTIKEKESSILYLNILLYLSIHIYNTNIDNIDEPKKIEKVINNVIDNFSKIKFKQSKNLEDIINRIKDIVKKNSDFRYQLNNLMSRNNHNSYININNGSKYYKVLYEYDIDELDDYDGKDIGIVIKKMNILERFSIISFNLCYFTVFKLLEKGIDYKLFIPIDRYMLTDEFIEEILLNANDKIFEHISFILDYEDVKGDYEFINHLRSKKLNVCIEVNKNFESDNYNMFLNVTDIVVDEEFLSLNDKYSEIWLDMEMNFIVKNMGGKTTEKELLGIK